MAQTNTTEWLMGGDFNEVPMAKEKLEGLSISNNKASLFKNYFNNYEMIDLGFNGCKYT